MNPQPRPDDSEQLLTIDEAAGFLRTPVATLRYWRHLGTGPRGFRIGRRVVYRHADITAWLDECAAAAGPPADGD